MRHSTAISWRWRKMLHSEEQEYSEVLDMQRTQFQKCGITYKNTQLNLQLSREPPSGAIANRAATHLDQDPWLRIS